jgi:putative iron-regulated protein
MKLTSLRWRNRPCLVLIICSVLLVACSRDRNSSSDAAATIRPSDSAPARQVNPQLSASIRQFIQLYLQQIEQDQREASQALQQMDAAIHALLDSPRADTLEQAREEWLNAYSLYELTTLHRYFIERIMSETDRLQLMQLTYQINHWPILPGYLDSVTGYADSGIVHDITVSLDGPSLREQHGFFELSEASLGFHVLEFLLWGENLDKLTPRPFSDFTAIKQLNAQQREAGLEVEQLPRNRRRQMLALDSQLLLEDFAASQQLAQQQSTEFAAGMSDIAPARLLTLVIDTVNTMFTEELLVRSLYPMLNGDFVDSFQSPYSHSTQNAVSVQLSSVERLLLETGTEQGLSLDQILIELSPEFEQFFYQNFDTSKECLVLLYSTFEIPEAADVSRQAEFDIVECINLLTNMIDHLQQIKIQLLNPA